MALQSKLFTTPTDPRLEDCLVDDTDHITPGSTGDHVKNIQIALNQLSSVFLKIDGNYGSKTAAAVKAYKNAPARKIFGPGQLTADNIVGKRTLKSLDDEMVLFERKPVQVSRLVSTTALSPIAHNHSSCPPNNPSSDSQGRSHHFGTPINPLGFGRKLNLGGEGETDYLGFTDVMPNRFGIEPRNRPLRPLTATIPTGSASDICLRFAPLLKDKSEEKAKNEILRLAAPGCRLTFCGLDPRFFLTMISMGRIIEEISIKNFVEPKAPGDPDVKVFVLVTF
jgi:hypothetical protein